MVNIVAYAIQLFYHPPLPPNFFRCYSVCIRSLKNRHIAEPDICPTSHNNYIKVVGTFRTQRKGTGWINDVIYQALYVVQRMTAKHIFHIRTAFLFKKSRGLKQVLLVTFHIFLTNVHISFEKCPKMCPCFLVFRGIPSIYMFQVASMLFYH